MLPLRLFLDSFGSFRAPATVDLHDVDYFALVGPTGAGKSTVIDAVCFALYGTAPRWGRENAVALALAPSATSGRVALVFEADGRRYGVVRVLARNARGTVGTREARLEELDPAVDPGADTEELLGAAVRSLAEGEQVTAEVQRITGLEYRFFTQCVVLPQGRFAEFLHAPPRKRQDLLVQLLDAEIYERIRQRATAEEGRATAAAEAAQALLDDLSGADEAAESAAAERLADLRALAERVRTGIDGLRERDAGVAELQAGIGAARDELGALNAVTMPAYVPTLATDLREAGEEAARLADEATASEEALAAAEEKLAGLGDRTELALALQAHEDHLRITGELTGGEAGLAAARAAAATAEERVAAAGRELAEAEARLRAAADARAAVAVARRLVVGEDCPVCLRAVTELPRHPVPAGLDAAERDVAERRKAVDAARERHRRADREVSGLDQRRAALQDQLTAAAERTRDHPGPEDLRRRLAAIEAAGRDAERARRAARGAARAHKEMLRRENALRERRDEALGELDAARDTVVAHGAPPLDKSDLHAAWTALLAWRDREDRRRRALLEELGARLDAAARARDEERERLRSLLAERGVPAPGGEADAIGAAAAMAVAEAGHRLERVREDRRRAAALAGQVDADRRDARVAHELAQRLRADGFEKWLCSEALEVLVAVASDTLRDLSDGRFELGLSDRSDIEVIDYAEAGMRRSVRTLSGGETFQASLALALALSDQVAGFGAAARRLDSIFLDEGFGTLDPATLDTVATTLERLSGGDRMVGLVTHVPALAGRVPVRFEVYRDSAGSHLEKRTT